MRFAAPAFSSFFYAVCERANNKRLSHRHVWCRLGDSVRCARRLSVPGAFFSESELL